MDIGVGNIWGYRCRGIWGVQVQEIYGGYLQGYLKVQLKVHLMVHLRVYLMIHLRVYLEVDIKIQIRSISNLHQIYIMMLNSIRALHSLTRMTLRHAFASKTIPLPFIADTISEGTIADFLKNEGQWVEEDQTVASVQTDKVTIEIKSPTAGLITRLHVAKGDTLNVGKPLFDVDPQGAKPTQAPKTAQLPKQAETVKQAVKQAETSKPKQASKPQEPTKVKEAPPQKKQPQHKSGRTESRQPMSRLRQRVAQRLKDSQNTYAQLTTFQEIDMSGAQNLRKDLGQDFLKKYNVKLGFMSIFLRAATLALQQFPIVNSVIDGNEVVQRDYVDISVAVATPTGLMVPVVRNCQDKGFAELEQELGALAKKGKDGKITLQDLVGGTFTVSNGGTFGSLMGTPILNPPQTAILGMHAIVNRPVVRGDTIVSRPIMYVALTYDHRLLDGKDAVLFLKKIQLHVEDPRRMLLDL